jgi:hypothetical protein
MHIFFQEFKYDGPISPELVFNPSSNLKVLELSRNLFSGSPHPISVSFHRLYHNCKLALFVPSWACEVDSSIELYEKD